MAKPQGWQLSVGMVKELYNKFNTVKELFNEADDILKFSIIICCYNNILL